MTDLFEKYYENIGGEYGGLPALINLCERLYIKYGISAPETFKAFERMAVALFTEDLKNNKLDESKL